MKAVWPICGLLIMVSVLTEEDARLAILRHATSKIQQVEDLFDIASLGLWEALAVYCLCISFL